MLRSLYRLAMIVLACVSSTLAQTTSAPSAASIETIEIEQTSDGDFFRVCVAWPSQGVPAEYAEFRQSEPPRRMMPFWPGASLALIPQQPGAFCICREAPSNAQDATDPSAAFAMQRQLPSPVIFVGRLRHRAAQEFLLRCPQPGGKWSYLPVSIDFTHAKPAKKLREQWLRSQAAEFSQAFSNDNSFFAFASERLSARLGRTTATISPQPEFSSSQSSERLYEITTGALAMQESLQLDRMRNPGSDCGARDLPLDRIEGVSIRAHPWAEMIGAKKPAIEPIAAFIPNDQYYVRFTTTRALSDFLEFADAWGGSLLGMAETGGRDYGVRERIETQICLKSTWLSRLLGPAVIESLAITGSDPYLREGSDITIAFHLKAPPVFEAAVSRFIADARKAHSDIAESSSDYKGVAIQSLSTPDQVVRCHRAKLDHYYLYSNSPAAIRRAIDAYKGERPSLARSLDFAYIRTLYPLTDAQEDGFIFLSDPFIRSLVGPRVRIAEKRRIEALTSLEMIKNAALLYLWENPGAESPSLELLYEKGFLEKKHLLTEPGDKLSWDPRQFVAKSDRYGRLGYLTPIIEMPLERVTAREADDYKSFRERYQSYWRRFFDPIGIRITAAREIALSVTILPLIDNTEYNQVKSFTGGKLVDLAPPKAAASAVFHLAAHLNPENEMLKAIQNQAITMLPGAPSAAVEWLGERLHVWIDDSDALTVAVKEQRFGPTFKIPIVVGIEVKNPMGLAAFLVAAQSMVRTSAPNMVIFEATEPYRDHTFTRIRPAPETSAGMQDMADAALYYGSVGRFFYISTSLASLHKIVDAAPATQPAQDSSGSVSSLPVPTTQPAALAHFALRLGLANAPHAREMAKLYMSQSAWAAEKAHATNLRLVARTVGLGPDAAASPHRILGHSIVSALGNTYHYDAAHDQVVGSVTGSEWDPLLLDQVSNDSPLGRLINSLQSVDASVSFTEDGLCTQVRIARK